MKLYKYQGAGNDFLIVDNRDGRLQLSQEQVAALCDRRYGIGADGLMLLENSGNHDFRMVYYNSDGSGGMMCGNGGRCIVAFAADKGIKKYDFEAADGFHTAEILSAEGYVKIVRLKMKNVDSAVAYDCLNGVDVPSEGYFLDTGTRHYVRFVENLDAYDVASEGRAIRYGAVELQPVGANVNFVEPCDGMLKVRTYEKGVEDETYACGTGIVASCLASAKRGLRPTSVDVAGRWRYDVKAKRDDLSVDFIPAGDILAEDIWLTGPATFVAEIDVNID
jgi:diaminopimelate epimerase